jgi:general secretion pathway protein G
MKASHSFDRRSSIGPASIRRPSIRRSLKRAPGRTAQAGFSLIEIILVVVLIGGIVAFAATRILGGGDRAKVNLAKAQVQTLAEKVQQFENDTGNLPGSLDELVTAPGNASGWLGPYSKAAELKDPWNHAFEYTVPGDGQPFDLVSLGKDGKPGGTSVDADIKYQ